MIDHQPSGMADIREVYGLMESLQEKLEARADRRYESLLALIATNHAEVMAAVAQLRAQSAVVRFFLTLWRPKVVMAGLGSVVGWFGFHGAQDFLMKFTGQK